MLSATRKTTLLTNERLEEQLACVKHIVDDKCKHIIELNEQIATLQQHLRFNSDERTATNRVLEQLAKANSQRVTLLAVA